MCFMLKHTSQSTEYSSTRSSFKINIFSDWLVNERDFLRKQKIVSLVVNRLIKLKSRALFSCSRLLWNSGEKIQQRVFKVDLTFFSFSKVFTPLVSVQVIREHTFCNFKLGVYSFESKPIRALLLVYFCYRHGRLLGNLLSAPSECGS